MISSDQQRHNRIHNRSNDDDNDNNSTDFRTDIPQLKYINTPRVTYNSVYSNMRTARISATINTHNHMPLIGFCRLSLFLALFASFPTCVWHNTNFRFVSIYAFAEHFTALGAMLSYSGSSSSSGYVRIFVFAACLFILRTRRMAFHLQLEKKKLFWL